MRRRVSMTDSLGSGAFFSSSRSGPGAMARADAGMVAAAGPLTLAQAVW